MPMAGVSDGWGPMAGVGPRAFTSSPLPTFLTDRFLLQLASRVETLRGFDFEDFEISHATTRRRNEEEDGG